MIGGHYPPGFENPVYSGHTWYEDKVREALSDEPDESATTYTCTVCESQTAIDTPQIRTKHWCEDCDGIETFQRSDKYYADGK